MVAVALLASCGRTGSTDDPAGKASGPDIRQDVEATLQQRARRLTAGDVEGYLAPLTPEARAAEEPIARGSTTVPLAEVNLIMDEVDFNDARTAASGARVDFIFRYKDLPEDNLFRFRLTYDLELREGSWVVTRSQYRKADLPMWATGPVEVASSPHFLALHRPGVGRIDESLQLAEAARVDLLKNLTFEPEARHLLLLAKDQVEYTELVGEEVAGSLALTSYTIRATAGHPARAENRQMAVNLQAVLTRQGKKVDLGEGHASKFGGAMEEDHAGRPRPGGDQKVEELDPRQVFQHELGHLGLTGVTRKATTGWVIEGGAMLLSGERRMAAWRLGQAAGIWDQMSFAELSSQANLFTGFEYAYANAAVSYLVETFGVKTFWNFYRDFKEYDSSTASSSGQVHPLEEIRADATHRLLRRIYNLNESQLDQKTREYIQRAIG